MYTQLLLNSPSHVQRFLQCNYQAAEYRAVQCQKIISTKQSTVYSQTYYTYNYCAMHAIIVKKTHLMSSVNVCRVITKLHCSIHQCSVKTIVTTKQCTSTVQVAYRKTTQHNKIQITKYKKKMQNTVGCSLVEVSCGETIQHNGRRCLSMSHALSPSLLIQI